MKKLEAIKRARNALLSLVNAFDWHGSTADLIREFDVKLEKLENEYRKEVPEASELEYLTWFHQYADFGPASLDVKVALQKKFEETKSLRVPSCWKYPIE